MVAVARECGVTLMEAMISTLNPNFRVVQEYLPPARDDPPLFRQLLPVLLALRQVPAGDRAQRL